LSRLARSDDDSNSYGYFADSAAKGDITLEQSCYEAAQSCYEYWRRRDARVTVGGIPFTRGPLAHLLRNRFYVGEVKFKAEVLVGEQPAIVDRDLFAAVQAKLDEQVRNYTTARMKSEALGTHTFE
jgi:hypothetical protein